MARDSLWQHITKVSKSALVIAALVSGPGALAQDDYDTWRWFEIEVLVFKHTSNQAEVESFNSQGPSAPSTVSYDPLPSYYVPDSRAAVRDLPECDVPTVIPTFSRDSLWCVRPWELSDWLPMNWHQPAQALAQLEVAPATVISGPGGPVQEAFGPYLAPAEQHELSEMREQIVRRGVGEPLLHMSWYQPVFEKGQNRHVRLFGGRNFGKDYAPSGYPYAAETSEFESLQDNGTKPAPDVSIKERLTQLIELQQQGELQFTARTEDQPLAPPLKIEQPPQPEPVWELDGSLHVYLVGNYLHIASDLELRQPQMTMWQPAELTAQADQALQGVTSGSFLRSFKLQQLRRVISHETHYFDHPKLGFAIQIRRTPLSARRY
ncbi:hypothetical protein PSI9734_00818 [Pseudidiomarina piscicola]|uniref:Uncharacterized protein n=1 Tax=Pseudidiomarina piscicola TaxID=2614830 RepID=A0A6S6WKJ8_9GAMM|nr:CsiV family protein [Pseudidiomarina piscicola]CAB0150264.1 hypothetical protein PSI9734_00818 [Pseudidiomarina piscicola]VZT39692.1 hypothetical protein PSI9734_00818 [Pseudomonas aeruginosa]